MAKQLRKKFDATFKREAIRLANESGKTTQQVEKNLGLYRGAICHWKNDSGEFSVEKMVNILYMPTSNYYR